MVDENTETKAVVDENTETKAETKAETAVETKAVVDEKREELQKAVEETLNAYTDASANLTECLSGDEIKFEEVEELQKAVVDTFKAYKKAQTALNDYDSKSEERAKKAETAMSGKEYYDSLKVGQIFCIINKGVPTLVKKILPKSGVPSGKSATCVLLISAGGKTDNRSPKFDKVLVSGSSEIPEDMQEAITESEEKFTA